MTVTRRFAWVAVAAGFLCFATAGVASAGQRQQTMSHMATMDAQLTTLTAQMNSATGEAKISAMAALLTAIVEQQKAMRAGMMGGAMNKETMTCSMMDKDAPAASPSSEAPAHVHP